MNSETWYKNGQTKIIKTHPVFFKRDGAGEALICIHGFPSSSWDFEKIWPSLVQNFDVIAHDLIGLGRSSKPNQELSIALQADIIEGLILELGIQKAHILAHDLGDTIAQELLARQHEGKAKTHWLSCVFLNGGLFPETHRPLLIQRLLLSPLGSLLSKLMTKSTFKKNLARVFSPANPPSEEFIRETWNLTKENNGLSMIPKLIHYMDERILNRDRWAAPLTNNIIPMRLINGEDDPISGKHLAKRFEELIPDSDVVLLKNSGHYPHVETPSAVLSAFIDFHNSL